MNAPHLAWSHSALNAFETCPRQFYLTRIAKTVVSPPSDEINWGRRVHKALEDRLNGVAPLPAELNKLESICQLLMAKHGRRLVEKKFSVDPEFNPTSFFDKRTWCRAVADFGLVGATTAFVLDWKTGKRKEEFDQLKILAGMVFAHYPYVDEVHTSFVWLKERRLDLEKYKREDITELWGPFLPRLKRFQAAHEGSLWPPKPSGLCGRWCPVSKQHCEFGH